MGRRSRTAAVTTVLGLVWLAGPAVADPVTLNFSGGIDLSTEGGPSVNTFSGSITWDPDAVPFETGPNLALYDPLSYTLSFNGVDVGTPVIGDGTGSGVGVEDDADVFGSGMIEDSFAFFLSIQLPFVLPSTGSSDLNLLGVLTGPTSMFSSTTLPANLNFLRHVTSSQTLAFFDAGGDIDRFVEAIGPLHVSAAPVPDPVPEPATLALTTLGLAACVSRARRLANRR